MISYLNCGQSQINIEVPETSIFVENKTAKCLEDPELAVVNALHAPIQSPSLSGLAAGCTDACIVISDITRPVPNKMVLPPILRTLEKAGIAPEKITILISTGMHRPNLGAELESMVGREIMDGYKIVNHYCRKDEDLRKVGEIDGAPIEINRHYLDADLKIITGLIEPHMYAGFSGGRKSILPGIASFRTMKFMHSFDMIDHPLVTNCVLDGNPFHEAGEKVADLVGVDFLVNVVINQKREMVGVFAGDYKKAHLAGCRMVEDHSVQRLGEFMDLVITSAGGYPLDATFYQVSKGLIMAKNLVKPGGKIVIACECREGLGSDDYCGMINRALLPEDFFKHHSKPENFEIDQWCLQTTYQAIDHASDIFVYSPNLTSPELGCLGIKKIDDVQKKINELLPVSPKVAVIPQGPYVVGLGN